MSNFLFEDFPSVSAKQWKQKIQFELMGTDYNQTLLSQTQEGISIKPFYHSDNFKQLEISEGPIDFEICQTIFVNNEKTANYLAIDALNRGANVIKFIAVKPFDFDLLFKGLNKSSSNKRLKVFFQFQFLNEEFLHDLIHFIKQENVFINIDIIGNLVKKGNWFHNHKKDHQILKNILKSAKDQITILEVDASHYQNSGANVVQQIAYALAHANEYLNYFESEIGSKINFKFSIGSNYFLEIAKLRAFRYLWNLLNIEYNQTIEANIFSEPSLRNKCIYDYNTNMLRTTTECMSAILGGANTISNVSYDSVFHKKNEFGERIARNQLLILKEESHLKNSDFVNGAYFIEQMTYEIAEKALSLFKNIEKSGGFIKQLFNGTIQRKIDESAKKEQQEFDNKESVLLGINRYTNEDDKMKHDIELYPFLKTKSYETIIQPVISKRLAEKIEQERLANE